MMGNDLLRRGRLLIYAASAALGGAAGSAGRVLSLWTVAPVTTLIIAAACARRKGREAGWLIVCVVALCAGLYLGYARHSEWRGRGGPAGEVSLVGKVEVGCRGGQGDIVDLFKVSEVLEGPAARCGDCYLLRTKGSGSDQPRWGDVLEVRGSLFIFASESAGVGGSLNADEIRVLGRTGNPFLRLALAYRDTLRVQVEGQLKPDVAGLIEGMVLGDYRLLSARDLLAFRVSGLIHLCAASGLNVAILAGFIIWTGRRLRLSRRMILILQVPLLITYALAVGLSVPIQRATVVAVLAVAAFFLGRDFDFLPAMGAAILYLLASDPSAVTGVSFQLCFGAALGMVLLHRPISEFLRAGKSKVLGLLAATLAAQLAVAPLLLYHFGEVSVLAIASNLLVLPLVAPVMALAMFSSLLGVAGLHLAAPLMRAAAVLTSGILVVARTLAAPRWAALRIFPFSAAWMAVYYPALAAAFLAGGRWRRRGRMVLAALIAAALLAGGIFPVKSLGSDGGMRITFIDVGQGDSVLLEAPSGAAVLVDGGIDDNVLAADLRSRGLRYLDAVIVSHPEADHIRGLEAAFDVCGIGLLVHPGTKSGGLAGDLLGRAEEMGVTVKTMRDGDCLRLGELKMTAQGPPVDAPEGEALNEYSLVLRVEGPGFSMLLTGDVEEEGEGMLMQCPEDLRCDILKVPHHGGFSETNDDFFSLVDPKIAVISVGEDNPYGHPSRATIDSLRRGGCSLYRTDLSGDIVIHVVEGGYRVECER